MSVGRASPHQRGVFDKAKRRSPLSSFIFTAVKKKHVFLRIGYIEDLERGRKEDERNGWEMVALKVEPRATENRFKWILQEFGFDKVAWKGVDPSDRFNDAVLKTARHVGGTFTLYTKPPIWRNSSKFSKPGNDSGKQHLFGIDATYASRCCLGSK